MSETQNADSSASADAASDQDQSAQEEDVSPPLSIAFEVPTAGESVQLPIAAKQPLLIVGANGSGKSSLMQKLYQANHQNAIRISAHRQNWMESNHVTFSPLDKVQNQNNIRNQDLQAQGRWKEWNAPARSTMVISDLLEDDNDHAREVRRLLASGDNAGAELRSTTPSALEKINLLLAGSGVPISLSIGSNSSLMAAKNGSAPFSAEALSDGERNALLISGAILTAPARSLVLVDEPERHLHPSIVTPLLIQLFALRPDCAFVVSTHELTLAGSLPESRIVIVRDTRIENNVGVEWDVDVLEPGADIDEATKLSILGGRRKIVFIEGTPDSLDQPLYELLFPNVSIVPRETCGAVEHSVDSIQAAQALTWVRPFGIIDQDQIDATRRSELAAKNVFALSVYSVEALYYHPNVIAQIAGRQAAVSGKDPRALVTKANDEVIRVITGDADRMAARMTEQAVKDAASVQMLDWKKIQAGQSLSIHVDAQAAYAAEKTRLQSLLNAKDISGIMCRYPIRETAALGSIVAALGFKGRADYEGAVRKLIKDDANARARMLGFFGGLPTALN